MIRGNGPMRPWAVPPGTVDRAGLSRQGMEQSNHGHMRKFVPLYGLYFLQPQNNNNDYCISH